MVKKRIVKRVKKPRGRKGGVVAMRAMRKPSLAKNHKPRQHVAIQLDGCRRPLRIKRNDSRKKKRDAEREQQRRRLKSLPTPIKGLFEVDDFVIDLEVHEISRAGLSQDRLTGDSAFEEQ